VAFVVCPIVGFSGTALQASQSLSGVIYFSNTRLGILQMRQELFVLKDCLFSIIKSFKRPCKIVTTLDVPDLPVASILLIAMQQLVTMLQGLTVGTFFDQHTAHHVFGILVLGFPSCPVKEDYRRI